MALAAAAESSGWDGFFLWDRIAYPPPGRAVADPWVALSAIALATETLRLGPMVTPLARRRAQKVARETVTLDRISNGRLTMGVGLGNPADFVPYGEVVDARERARLLDESLDRLDGYWAGEFEPRPVQRPRIPVWVAANWPHRRPVRRAMRWDGLFPIDLPGPDELAVLATEIRRERGDDDGFDLVVEVAPGAEIRPWADAGATWALTSFDPQPPEEVVREVIAAGP
ncbi:TIGR03619 family F420-dependent LLM class oxidoreductase [Cryptosporangium minutisporangium]|uniref:TIGR03619 family F420-dependent LLM class oxidoreductase n=1 Tax=Cryptosporangium minutisporangium TaxID=113569 RepID=A0ABP6T3V0_9ACTN